MSPGSLSFAKLMMMSSAPAKSAGDARSASQPTNPPAHHPTNPPTHQPTNHASKQASKQAINQSINQLYLPSNLQCSTEVLISSSDCPIQSRLQSVFGVRSFYVERNYGMKFATN